MTAAITPGRAKALLDLAGDLETARDAYLSALENQNADAMTERREVLERMLWDDKGTVIDALRLAAHPASDPDAMNERRADADTRLAANVREACAKIAEPWPGYWLDENSTDIDRAVVAVRTEIAEKIRAGAPKP